MGNRIDTLINAVLFFIIGFLFGSVFSEIPIRTADVSSVFIAVAAIYGIIKWKAQHDYQIEKTDKKNLIKLTKKMRSYVSENLVCINLLNKNLTAYVREKNDFEKSTFNTKIVKNTLERLTEVNRKLREVYSDFEVESSTTYLTVNNERLQTELHRAIFRAEDFIATSNAMTSVCKNFELLEHDENGDFDEIENDAKADFKRFIEEISKVERLLNIHNYTRARAKSRKILQEIDKTTDDAESEQSSP